MTTLAAVRRQGQADNGSPRSFRNRVIALAAGALTAAVAALSPAAAGERGYLTAEEFARYRAAFMKPDGRIVDPENGGISHSESQGYGMILAVEAGDQAAFDRIWGFARRTLQVRDDALFVWRYDPRRTDPLSDRNNASDGDILIAYALIRGALRWNEARYLAAADPILVDIGRHLVTTHGGEAVLRPAAFGFDRIIGNEGPVLNLSYWIYQAFPLFERVRPEFPWMELARSGMRLTERAQRATGPLVPDWARVEGGRVLPARGFDVRFSYDAVRVPLYLAAAGAGSASVLGAFDERWNIRGNGVPQAVDLRFDAPLHAMGDPGYRMIAALVACAARGREVPAYLTHFEPTTYFASTLHLLSLVAVRRHYPECLAPPPPRAVPALTASGRVVRPEPRPARPVTRRAARPAPRITEVAARGGGVRMDDGSIVPRWVARSLRR